MASTHIMSESSKLNYKTTGVDGECKDVADVIGILTSQHREIDALFRQLELAGIRTAEAKEKAFAALVAKISQHANLEENVFYPAVKEINREVVLQAFEEHDVIKYLIREIQKMQPGSELFAAKIHVLKELVKHHITEEVQLFPKCRSVWSEADLALINQKVHRQMAQGEGWISAETH